MSEREARWEYHTRMSVECFVFSLKAWEELGVCEPVEFIMRLKRAERERQRREARQKKQGRKNSHDKR